MAKRYENFLPILDNIVSLYNILAIYFCLWPAYPRMSAQIAKFFEQVIFRLRLLFVFRQSLEASRIGHVGAHVARL